MVPTTLEAEMAPLHSSLGERLRLCLKKTNKDGILEAYWNIPEKERQEKAFALLIDWLIDCILGFGVHVQNMQDSCIGIHMAVCFAAFFPFTYIWRFSPCYLSPTPHPPLSLRFFPATDPSVWCFPPCVHVFSLFNTCLWVRTCGVWFSVLVSVCWE